MQSDISDTALDYLLARAGLDLTAEQKAELKTVHAALAEMAERVHTGQAAPRQFDRGELFRGDQPGSSGDGRDRIAHARSPSLKP